MLMPHWICTAVPRLPKVWNTLQVQAKTGCIVLYSTIREIVARPCGATMKFRESEIQLTNDSY